MSNFEEMKKRAAEIRKGYDRLNEADGHRRWDAKERAMGFVGDVGDLLKLVMAKEGLRRGDDIDAKLAHELADCLWSVIVIAEDYNIDLAKEFSKTMNDLEKRIQGGING